MHKKLKAMKKIFIILAPIFFTISMYAQSPEKMSYQAVIRNSSDVLVTNRQVGMEINIRKGLPTGTIVYTETKTSTTNANGLVSIDIGGELGFNTIDWGNDSYFIEIKTAIVPPLTTYTITGTSQLLSVPYALYAKTAGSYTEIDGSVTNEIEMPINAATGDMAYFNGTSWVKVIAGRNNQILTYCDGVPKWTNGGLCTFNPFCS